VIGSLQLLADKKKRRENGEVAEEKFCASCKLQLASVWLAASDIMLWTCKNC
jgi:hypothetical protein